MEGELLQLIKSDDIDKICNFLDKYIKIIDWKKIIIQNPKNSCENFILGCMYFWGRDVKKDYQKASYYFELSAKQGNYVAQNNLAYLYRKGLGIRKDEKKAFYYYELSAKQNYFQAQHNLGKIYQHGFGVEKDYSKAIYYYLLSAEQGDLHSKKRIDKILEIHDLEMIKNIYQKNVELEIKNKELEKKIEKMEEEMKYIPGYGKIFLEAKEHFEDHKN